MTMWPNHALSEPRPSRSSGDSNAVTGWIASFSVTHFFARFAMKAYLFTILAAASFLLPACDNSHVSANVPAKGDFRPFLLRDLTAYFQSTFGSGITLDYELLRDVPTQVGVAYPKYYIWVTITKPDKSVVGGAARIAAINSREFRVTVFIPQYDIVADPEQLAQVFPEVLLEKIRAKAGVKQ